MTAMFRLLKPLPGDSPPRLQESQNEQISLRCSPTAPPKNLFAKYIETRYLQDSINSEGERIQLVRQLLPVKEEDANYLDDEVYKTSVANLYSEQFFIFKDHIIYSYMLWLSAHSTLQSERPLRFFITEEELLSDCCETLKELQDDLTYNAYPLVTLLTLVNNSAELIVLKIQPPLNENAQQPILELDVYLHKSNVLKQEEKKTERRNLCLRRLCEVGSKGIKFEDLRHNEIVVNEVENIDHGSSCEVLRCIARVRQVVMVLGESGQERSIEEIQDEIRNLIYHFYDYQCFQDDSTMDDTLDRDNTQKITIDKQPLVTIKAVEGLPQGDIGLSTIVEDENEYSLGTIQLDFNSPNIIAHHHRNSNSQSRKSSITRAFHTRSISSQSNQKQNLIMIQGQASLDMSSRGNNNPFENSATSNSDMNNQSHDLSIRGEDDLDELDNLEVNINSLNQKTILTPKHQRSKAIGYRVSRDSQILTIDPLVTKITGETEIEVFSHEFSESVQQNNISHRRRRPSIYKHNNNRKKSISREEFKEPSSSIITFGGTRESSQQVSHRENNQLFTLMPDYSQETVENLALPSERAVCVNDLDKTNSETLFNRYTPTKHDMISINTKRNLEVTNKTSKGETSQLTSQLKLKLNFDKVSQKIKLQKQNNQAPFLLNTKQQSFIIKIKSRANIDSIKQLHDKPQINAPSNTPQLTTLTELNCKDQMMNTEKKFKILQCIKTGKFIFKNGKSIIRKKRVKDSEQQSLSRRNVQSQPSMRSSNTGEQQENIIYGCRNYQDYQNSVRIKQIAMKFNSVSPQRNDENRKPLTTQPTVSSGEKMATLQKCKSCHGSGWNTRYNMPCQNCNEVPSLKDLQTPRTAKERAQFLQKLNSTEFKNGKMQVQSITPRALAQMMQFSDNNTLL